MQLVLNYKDDKANPSVLGKEITNNPSWKTRVTNQHNWYVKLQDFYYSTLEYSYTKSAVQNML
jgi:hypothetical protein